MNPYESWKEEKSSAFLYKLLAAKEKDQKQDMFLKLSKSAEDQANLWLEQMRKINAVIPTSYKPNVRVRIVAWLIQHLEIKQLRYILPAMKIRGMAAYLKMPGHPMPTSIEDLDLIHKKGGSAGGLRAAVFGINDGLVSNVSLIMGMAGANASHNTIILAGVAGLLAGAFSMAAGEYVSVRSQREMLQYQIALEKKELELYPKEESEELALIYHARGLPKEEARHLADQVISNPAHALDELIREELGINPEELSSPWQAGIFSFCFFTLGAFIPLLPFLFGIHIWSFKLSIILTAVALFSVGSSLSLYVGRKGLWGGLRMLLIGGGAGCITYLIGHVLGVTLG